MGTVFRWLTDWTNAGIVVSEKAHKLTWQDDEDEDADYVDDEDDEDDDDEEDSDEDYVDNEDDDTKHSSTNPSSPTLVLHDNSSFRYTKKNIIITSLMLSYIIF